MLRLLILTSAIVIASASICCFPGQWHSIQSVSMLSVSVSGGPPSVQQVTQVMNADYNKKMIAIEGKSEYNGAEVPYKLFYDFKAGKQYTTYPGGCVAKPMPREPDAFCIPDNAQFLGEGYIGFSNRTLNVRKYGYDFNGQSLQITVNKENCNPIQQLLSSTTNGTFNAYTVVYVNATNGLTSPDALNLPVECGSHLNIQIPVIFGRRHTQ